MIVKSLSFLFLVLIFSLNISLAQTGPWPAIENLGSPQNMIDSWDAKWITHPDISLNDYSVIHFRKSFQLDKLPEEFIIHITADNRYRLFVNGEYVSKGSARSDKEHWYYATLDILPFLQTGTNLLAVEVVNFGPKRAFAQFSHATALFVQGHTEAEAIVNTSWDNWKVYHNRAMNGRIIEWMQRKDVAFGLYVANPTDSVIGDLYPWGWEKPDFNDSDWPMARMFDIAGGRDMQYAGGILYSGGWMLVPRPMKLLEERRENFTSVARSDGSVPPDGFFNGKKEWRIPANKKVVLLIDHKYMTVGYPELVVSGGKGSKIKTRYAETLYHTDRMTKGNRDDLEGKIFIGYGDVWLTDGGDRRMFRPLWLRTFRFIRMKIETGDEPLIIHDYYNRHSAYPLKLNAAFKTDNSLVNKLMDPGWRTVSLCAQDFLLSDGYYEQMQYVGDCKVHNLAILYLSGNDDLVRNQLLQTDWSRIHEGLTLACYPNDFPLVIPLYSMTWIEMIHDYMMWSGDKKFVSQFVMGIDNVLRWYQDRIQTNGLLGPIQWWNYVDWSKGFTNGVPPGIKDGNSALFTLEYAIVLERAADIYRFIGKKDEADNYLQKANKIKAAVRLHCYDKQKQLFSDTPEMKYYSMHTNILAVLSGLVDGEEAKQIMEKVMEDKSLSQTALFYHYYYFEALFQTGLAGQIIEKLEPWFDMVQNGMTCFAEAPLYWEHQRSDCHPWSASPNIHFYSSVCGIRPLEPGFSRVRISPSFGNLKELEASFKHPKGTISLKLKKARNEKCMGTIDLPDGITGEFFWNGEVIELKGGSNKIK